MQPIEYTDLLVKNLITISQLNAQIIEYLDRVNRNDQHFVTLEDGVRSESLFYFSYCINVKTQMKEARKFVLGMNKLPEENKERIILNIRNMFDYINASYAGERFGFALLNHLNKLFLDNVKDIWDVGKLVNTAADIDGSYDMWKGKDILLASQVGPFAKTLEDIYITSPLADILKILSITHSLLTSQIFACGNDAVALGVFAFLMRKSGYTPFVDYYKCFHTVNQAMLKDDQGNSFRMWMELFVNEMVRELKDLKTKLIPFVDDVRSSEAKYIDLNARQVKGLTYIQEKGKISREMYARLNNVSQITSYRDLSGLLQKGYVRVEGIGKATKYVI